MVEATGGDYLSSCAFSVGDSYSEYNSSYSYYCTGCDCDFCSDSCFSFDRVLRDSSHRHDHSLEVGVHGRSLSVAEVAIYDVEEASGNAVDHSRNALEEDRGPGMKEAAVVAGALGHARRMAVACHGRLEVGIEKIFDVEEQRTR